MEQTQTGKYHGDAIPVAGIDHMVVADGAAGLCNKGNAAAVSALDVIPKGEKCVGAQRNADDTRKVAALFLATERRRASGKKLLLGAICQHLFRVVRKVHVDGVVTVQATDIRMEGQAGYLRMLAQMS